MVEQSSSAGETIRRQVQEHLQSLRQAGVEWLPAAPAQVAVAQAASECGAALFNAAEAGPAATTSLEDRRRALRLLAQEVAPCTRCAELAAARTQTVFGVGEPGVELCFIGEAPGADEDAQGEPFVGAAGQLLNRIIAACNLKREEVYICNIIKCRPPGNRTPLPHEAANCREYLV